MLGRTAGSLFWTFRYLERMENTARLLEAAFHIGLSYGGEDEELWKSVISTIGVSAEFEATGRSYNQQDVADYLLRDKQNFNSVMSMLTLARDNARVARTALTNEVWESINQAWIDLGQSLKNPIKSRHFPEKLTEIRTHSQQVRGALHGTMLRNDIYDFLRLGNFVERFAATARILDVKYYYLLPSISYVGATIDNIQWEIILRSVSAYKSYHWLYPGKPSAAGIADYLILDRRFPRSMQYSLAQCRDHLNYLSKAYGETHKSLALAQTLQASFDEMNTDKIFAIGLHEFIEDCLAQNAALSAQIEQDFRFYA